MSQKCFGTKQFYVEFFYIRSKKTSGLAGASGSRGGLGYLANAAANSMGHRNDRGAEGAEGVPVAASQQLLQR